MIPTVIRDDWMVTGKNHKLSYNQQFWMVQNELLQKSHTLPLLQSAPSIPSIIQIPNSAGLGTKTRIVQPQMSKAGFVLFQTTKNIQEAYFGVPKDRLK
jgi:hypothetical protein